MTHHHEMSVRFEAVRRALEAAEAAVAVFGLSSNLRYLTGFSDEPGERMLLLLVPREGEAAFVVPELYADQVEAHSPPATLRAWADGEDPGAILMEIADDMSRVPGKVLLDDSLWSVFCLRVQAAFPRRALGLASTVMTPLRQRKDDAEIAAMRRAGEIADAAYATVTAQEISGLTEIELAGRLEAAMFSGGADGVAFETLVASGPNSALPHHRAGARTIEPGDAVILDYGCRVNGYCSDISRTVVCGEPTVELVRVHAAVCRANQVARDRVGKGLRAEEVDAAARDVLVNAGYGDRFLHRTGHGIGLDIHEPPYIVKGNQQRLEEGMTFSIEPGAYFRQAFGVRIEDVVVVTGEGAGAMTHASRDLKCVR